MTHSCNGSFLNQTAVDTKSAQYGYLGERRGRRLPGGRARRLLPMGERELEAAWVEGGARRLPG